MNASTSRFDSVPAVLDRILKPDLAGLDVELDLLLVLEALEPVDLQRLLQLLSADREVVRRVGEEVRAEHHVLGRRRERAAVRR